METKYVIGVIIISLCMVMIISYHIKNKKFPPDTGKKCMLVAGTFSLCTPPRQGDKLNGKIQKEKILFYREISREVIYKAEDGYQVVGITYEYWDSIPSL